MPLLLLLAFIFQALIFQGTYIKPLGVIICRGERACFHEQAHMRDAENGDVSKSYDYILAVSMYRFKGENFPQFRDEFYEFSRDFPGIGSERYPYFNPLSSNFWEHPIGTWGGYSEFYPDLWAEAGGDINRLPETLRPFYRDFKALGYVSALQEH